MSDLVAKRDELLRALLALPHSCSPEYTLRDATILAIKLRAIERILKFQTALVRSQPATPEGQSHAEEA